MLIHLDPADEKNGALEVVHGSHKKRLSDKEIALITENCVPNQCHLPAGGVHLLRPLVLHRSLKSRARKHRRVIHLEFSSAALGNGIDWAERMALGQKK